MDEYTGRTIEITYWEGYHDGVQHSHTRRARITRLRQHTQPPYHHILDIAFQDDAIPQTGSVSLNADGYRFVD